MLAVADGSDFMGSLRNPAGWNDVYGFRPSQGRVPRWPAADVWVALLSTEGPMGRTVKDVAALLDVQSGWDARTPLAIAAKESFAANVDRFDPRGVRIGWLGDLDGYLPMEPGVADVCARALARIEDAGGTVEPAALGFAPERVWETWLVWRRWSVAARIAPHLRDPANRARIKPEALWEYDQGQGLTGMDTVHACAERTAFYNAMLRLFERYDALALPTAQVWPFPAEWRWPREVAGRAMDTYHRWMEAVIYATLAGLPCIAMPAGFGATGLPMGVQLIGRPHGDLGVLQLARAFERIGVGPTRSVAAGGVTPS
jgi:amidase